MSVVFIYLFHIDQQKYFKEQLKGRFLKIKTHLLKLIQKHTDKKLFEGKKKNFTKHKHLFSQKKLNSYLM